MSLARHHPTCAAPATVKRTSPVAPLLSTLPLQVLNKLVGRRQRLFPSARIPANKAVVCNPPYSPSTVGEGGEGANRVFIMSFRTCRGPIWSLFFTCLLTLCFNNIAWAQPPELNPIVVSATRFEIPLTEVLPSASVITREQIESSQATTLADLLQGQAGFEFGRNGGPGTVTSFFLRGQDSTNMLLLIDGVRVQTDSIGSLTLTEFPLPLIERIEILRGNAGALYGEAAIGGVISVQTRQADGKPQAFGAITLGPYKTTDTYAGYNSADTNGLRFNIMAGHNQSKGFTAMDPAQNNKVNPDRDGYRNDYLQGKVEKKVDSGLKLGARISLLDSKLDYDRGDSFLSYPSDKSSDTHQFKKKNESLGLYVLKQLNPDWLMRFDISATSLSYLDFRNDQQPRSGDGSYLNGAMTGDQRTLKWSSLWQADSKTSINMGFDTQQDTYTATGDNAFNMKRSLQGVFAGLNRQWDRLTLQLNARHDSVVVTNTASGNDNQNNTHTNTGLIGLGWRLNSNWMITSAVSSGFRAPTAFDVSQNSNLKPEKHRSQEVGLVHTMEHSLSKLVYFESIGRDVIDYMPPPTYATENIGEIRNKGWEATSHSSWGPYKLLFSAVLQDPWSVTHQEQLSRRARHYGSVNLSRQWQGFDLGARVIASGERKNSHYDTNSMGGYSVWSLYVSRRLDTEWSAQVKLDNAFDRKYQLAYGYNTPGSSFYATLRYQPKL